MTSVGLIAKYLFSCYGLTQDPEIYDFMLVLDIYDYLHSGNILIDEKLDSLRICDLGFCGPVEKDSNSINVLEAKDNGILEETFLFGKSLPVDTYFQIHLSI
ncbi:6307_t:CDS:2 [Racocetra fulgida]|uniref:6307_t:CDS:1 n=1 Tax=Racocetra fulgida TaxID=60492 RepID=A0A9N8YVF3_9GLOM|nr:6307_t:CDS:2 [Racocetra fulgida]